MRIPSVLVHLKSLKNKHLVFIVLEAEKPKINNFESRQLWSLHPAPPPKKKEWLNDMLNILSSKIMQNQERWRPYKGQYCPELPFKTMKI